MIAFSHYDHCLTDGSDPYKTFAVYLVDGIRHDVVTARQVFLELDQATIPSDGITTALLMIRTSGWDSVTVEITIGSSKIEQLVDILDGVGTLDIAADTPGTATVSIKEVICEPITLEVL